MAGKVFFSVSMSLDGFIAPESPDQLMGQQWMELQRWVFAQRHFRENLGIGEGGEEGRDNDSVRETFERTGASIMGKRMFDAGEHAWPEDPPFHPPVFVVTHEVREPWPRTVRRRNPALRGDRCRTRRHRADRCRAEPARDPSDLRGSGALTFTSSSGEVSATARGAAATAAADTAPAGRSSAAARGVAHGVADRADHI